MTALILAKTLGQCQRHRLSAVAGCAVMNSALTAGGFSGFRTSPRMIFYSFGWRFSGRFGT